MEEKKLAVIWDWDYTLVNSAEPNYQLVSESVMKITGKPLESFPSLKNTRTYIKKLWSYHNWREFYTKELGITTAQIEEVADFWVGHSLTLSTKPKFYKGIKELIITLDKLGVQQAILSDNTSGNIKRWLKESNLLGYFSCIIGYHEIKEDNLKHKPAPDGLIRIFKELKQPGLLFFVGDVVNDMLAADGLEKYFEENKINSKIIKIWATHGLTKERIKMFSPQISADHTVKNPEELLSAIEEEINKQDRRESDPTLPTREECFRLWDEYKLPGNIRKHSRQVDRIAVFMAKKLRESGIDIDIELVDRAALIHDLDKLLTLKTRNHGEITEQILREKGYPKLGEVAKCHRFRHIHDRNLSWEGKVLMYADKRVKHDKIASLAERLHDFIVRYNINDDEKDREADEHFHRLEGELFSLIKLDPGKLESYLK